VPRQDKGEASNVNVAHVCGHNLPFNSQCHFAWACCAALIDNVGTFHDKKSGLRRNLQWRLLCLVKTELLQTLCFAEELIRHVPYMNLQYK
jgi:hypothetical protein